MLPDLNQIACTAQKKYTEEFSSGEFMLSDDFKEAYGAYMRRSRQNIEFTLHTAIITTAGNLRMYIPNQWFKAAAYTVNFVKELYRYKALTELVLNPLYPVTQSKKDYIKKLKESDSQSDSDEYRTRVESHIKQVRNNPADVKSKNFIKEICGSDTESLSDEKWSCVVDRLVNFACNYEWWFGSKTIDRGDYYVSPVLSMLKVVNVSQAYIAEISNQFASENTLTITVEKMVEENIAETSGFISPPVKLQDDNRETGGINLIVYGAPGTGKSRYLEDTFGKPPLSKRIVFHPEYSYFDFVGAYKPIPVYKNSDDTFHNIDGSETTSGEPYIDYRFVPGPFIQALAEAWLDPSHMHTLIIEEINRANAASVFGEVFQLLDRDINGYSEYSFTPSEDLYRYLLSINGMQSYISSGIKIPSNLNIVATMNSADQGVKPIDSAFKRRWGFHYIKIEFNGDFHETAIIRYAGQDVYWGRLIQLINTKLSNRLHLDEDKLIGPYFIKPDELGRKQALDKLLLYLWDDVLRHNREIFFKSSINTFSELSGKFESEDVFDIMLASSSGDMLIEEDLTVQEDGDEE